MDKSHPALEFATKAEVEADAVDRVATFHGFARIIFWSGFHALMDAFGVILLLNSQIVLGLLFIVAGTTILASVIISVVNGSGQAAQTFPAGSGREPTPLRRPAREGHGFPPGIVHT
jgi:hypothetical protein